MDGLVRLHAGKRRIGESRRLIITLRDDAYSLCEIGKYRLPYPAGGQRMQCVMRSVHQVGGSNSYHQAVFRAVLLVL